MADKLEIKLIPFAGSVKEKNGYQAVIKSDGLGAMNFDEVVAEARRRIGFMGMSDNMIKDVVREVFQSMIDGVLSDGRTRRIDDFLSIELKVHGKFTDAEDDFDPERHSLALSVRPLKKFRPSFEDIDVTNPNHKRQFRIYTVRSVDGKSRAKRVFWGQDFVIKGGSLISDGFENLTAQMYDARGKSNAYLSADIPVKSKTDSEIVCGWPEEFADESFSKGTMVITIWKEKDPDDTSTWRNRDITVIVEKPEPGTAQTVTRQNIMDVH